MSEIVQATGTIIRQIRHGETSLILTVFTRERGNISLIAKGARVRSKTASPAALQLLCESSVVYYRKPSREIQILKEWSLANSHSGLRSSFECLAVGSAVAELLARCLHDEDSHPDLYEVTAETLTALDGQPAEPLPFLWRFELALFEMLGFALNLRTCRATQQPLIPPFSAAVRYNLGEGCFYRPGIVSGFAVHGELSADAFSLMSQLPESGSAFLSKLRVGQRVRQEISDFLKKYLETHLPISAHLRSLDALNWSVSRSPGGNHQ